MRASLVLTVFFAGCGGFGPGSSDFSRELSGGYFLYRNSSHTIFVAPQIWNDETPIIPENVIECDFDTRFIIAKQQLLKRRSPNDSRDTYMEPAPGQYCYWILSVQPVKAYGPMTLDEFDSKREELQVPASLRLKNINSFR